MALEAIWHHLYKHLFYNLHLGIDSIVLNIGFNLKKVTEEDRDRV